MAKCEVKKRWSVMIQDVGWSVVMADGTDASGKMTFVVTPGDGTANRAFLRIKR